MSLTTPDAFMITGSNPIVRLRFDNGMELRCTPSHRLFTANRGYVEAGELTADDRVVSLDLPAPAIRGGWSLPVETDWDVLRVKGERDHPLHLPEMWTDEFAHYLGWLVGDGSTSGVCTATIYGSADDRTEILPRHQDLIERINGGRPLKVSEQAERHRAAAPQPPGVQALPRIARRRVGDRRAQACSVVDRAGPTRGGGGVPPRSVRR